MGKVNLSTAYAIPENVFFEYLPDSEDKLVGISIRCPPALLTDLERLLRHPALTGGRSGLLRWCLFRGLLQAAEALKMDALAGDLQAVAYLSDLAREARLHGAFEAGLNRAKGQIQNYLDRGMIGAAKALWDSSHMAASKITDEFWRAKYREVLESKEFQALATWKPEPPKPGKPVLVGGKDSR